MYSSVRMIPVVHLTEIMLRSYLQKNRKEEAVKEDREDPGAGAFKSSRTLPHEAGKEVWVRDSG